MGKPITLSKSDFLKYLQCNKHLWLNKNRRDLLPEVTPEQQAIFDQGYRVEDMARKLFPEGVEVQNNFKKGQMETKVLIEKGVEVIYQATVMPFPLLARADILIKNKAANNWDLYEVKSSTELKEEHLPDIGFQKIAFQKDGINIGRTFLICINGDYIHEEEVDPTQLLKIEEVSEQIANMEGIIETQIPKDLEWLKNENEPEKRIGKQCDFPYTCPFKDYCWKNVPTHSIFEISRLAERKLEELLDRGVIKIEDLPEDFELTERQKNHVDSVKANKPFVDEEKIMQILNELEYPLYFLDYETFAPAIPLYQKTKPYQQICFQYSLHILNKGSNEVGHKEFLETTADDPRPKLLEHLEKDLGPTGTVIVWNKGFEMGRNKEMAETFPAYRVFLENLNARVFDLMEIFRDQHFVHPEFHGSHSIKKVLPVLVPGTSHQDLEIHNGGMASLGWFQMIFGNLDQATKKDMEKNLLEYCKLDTLAMVMIYKNLLTQTT